MYRIRPRSAPLAVAAAATLCVLGWAVTDELPAVGAQPPPPSADVIVGDLPSVFTWGESRDGSIAAYSVATTSCNIGTAELLWDRDTADHPVIGQNLYRLRDGRFEQIGMSWLKHGFFALQGTLCATPERRCRPTSHPGRQRLGVNCSDPYSATLNGGSGDHMLGPRSGVTDPARGRFRYPHGAQPITDPTDRISRRLQVRTADLEPALNRGARYFVEGHYVTRDDAEAGNAANNASYREVFVTRSGDRLDLLTRREVPTVRTRPAIHAWAAADPRVRLYVRDVPGDGRFTLAVKSELNDDGTVHTEVAVHNLNSTRGASSLSFAVEGGGFTGLGFHDVEHHSGEPYSGADWTPQPSGDRLTWATRTFAQDPNANALRWGTMYSFRFDAAAAPTSAEIGLFGPGGNGAPSSVVIDLTDDGVEDKGLDPDQPWLLPTEDSVDLGTLRDGGSSAFVVYCQRGIDCQLDTVKASSEKIHATSSRAVDDGVVRFRIDVAKVRGAAPGYLETALLLRSDQPGAEPREIRAYGRIE